MLYGTIIRYHREFLELTQFEYAVIARCNPAQVKSAEAGKGRLPKESERILVERYQVTRGVLAKAKTGAMDHIPYTPGDPWTDIPFVNHSTARNMVVQGVSMSQEEIARFWGVKRQAIQQTEAAAMRKIRNADGGGRLEAEWAYAAVARLGEHGHALERGQEVA